MIDPGANMTVLVMIDPGANMTVLVTIGLLALKLPNGTTILSVAILKLRVAIS